MGRTKGPFPKQLFIVRETDDNDPEEYWFHAVESLDDLEPQNNVVAVYEKAGSEKLMKIRRELVD